MVPKKPLDRPFLYVGVVVLALLVSLAIPALLPLRWLTGAALVLYLPGYVWVSALFAGEEPPTGWHITMSLGLSISCAVLCGLLLNLTPWGLTTATWLIALASIALAGALICVVRGDRRNAAREVTNERGPSPRWFLSLQSMQSFGARLGLTGVRTGLLVAALVIVLIAGAVAVVGAETVPQSEQVIQFWMVPSSTSGKQTTEAQIGVQAVGPAPTTEYNVVVLANGAELTTLGPFSVKPGGDWKATLNVASLPANTLVEADLYRANAPNQVYRSVWIWTTK